MNVRVTSGRMVVLVVALGLMAAACSGSAESGVASLEGSTTTTAAASTEIDTEQALFAFAACMRDNGIDIEDPTVDADGNVDFGAIRGPGPQGAEGEVDREALRAAREECSQFLEDAALGFRERDSTEFQDTLYEFAQCMRDNGVDMPDPDLSSFGPGAREPGQGGGPFGDLDRDDPAFQAAFESCEEILAGFGPPGGAPPGGRGGG